MDFTAIARKWQSRWEKEKLFEPIIKPKQKKFFLTFPFPYVNFSPHLGHFYTIMRVEAFARYKRAQGFNVLFPQAWHCTGTPIVSSANRVKEREPTILENLRKEGFTEKDWKSFEQPEHWIKIFSKRWEEDLKHLGLSIDWRRTFITTALNPHYDKFIQWQFNKLKALGYVEKGKHAVVWCPKDNLPLGDHDRSKGEGETPQEFTLLKSRVFGEKNKYVVAATLRPETVFGQTNLWISPESEYVEAAVDGEIWIISASAVEKLKQQDKKIKIEKKIQGKSLLGRKVHAAYTHKEIPILPSSFCDLDKGTGIVTSVPSDAPDDYMGLRDLQATDVLIAKYKLNKKEIHDIKVIPIIDAADLGETAAVKIVEEMKIKNQHDRKRLEEAKKIVYKKGFYEGMMKKSCGKFAGMKVEAAKEKIKQELLKAKEAELFYELSGEVICRCLTRGIIKIVGDQWFLTYSNEAWKKKTHHALKKLQLYPEVVREQFTYVINWLNDWACAREYGMGTRLPFDEKWLIESLSDSTIYMAYYTITHLIGDIEVEKLTDEVFDYIFLGKGKKPAIPNIDALKNEFEYWYPLDFRNSGKDLVQNHLAFFMFNHVAIFPEKYWPKAIGVNGWVRVNGQKMSKSLGNFITLHDMHAEYGADASRITMLNGGEGIDDPNWDTAFAENIHKRFTVIIDLAAEYGKGTTQKRTIDQWMEHRLAQHGETATNAMEKTLFRTAIQSIYFDLMNDMKWYLKRAEEPNKKILAECIEALLIMMQPITPHLAEELWSTIKKTFISTAVWPKYKSQVYEDSEGIIRKLIADLYHVMNNIIKKKPNKVYIYVIPKELKLYTEAQSFLEKEMGFNLIIYANNDKNIHDPLNKSQKAQPGKPAIYFE